jgi:hypothetical protein
MTTSNTYDLGDTLHRLVKQALDNGICKSIPEAEQLFQRYRLHIEITPEDVARPDHQACLLTVIALARRVFLGGVTCDDAGDTKLIVPLPLGHTVNEAVVALTGRPKRLGQVHSLNVISGWREKKQCREEFFRLLPGGHCLGAVHRLARRSRGRPWLTVLRASRSGCTGGAKQCDCGRRRGRLHVRANR